MRLWLSLTLVAFFSALLSSACDLSSEPAGQADPGADDQNRSASQTKEAPPQKALPEKADTKAKQEPPLRPPPGGIQSCSVTGKRFGTSPPGKSPIACQAMTFELGQDDAFEMHVGEAKVTGQALVESTTVTFTDQSSMPENVACNAAQKGRYRFRMSGGCVLTLEAQEDPCAGRRSVLDGAVLCPNPSCEMAEVGNIALPQCEAAASP